MNKRKHPVRAWLVGGIVLTTFFTATPLAYAVENTWTGNGGDNQWETPANWSLGSIPAGRQHVLINDEAQVQAANIIVSNTPYCYSVFISDESQIQAANIIVGDAGAGSFSQLNSAVTITDTLTLGKQQGGSGSYYLGDWESLSGFKVTAGGTLQAASIIIGDAGAGSFHQLNSAVTITDTLTLGKQQGKGGSYYLGPSEWSDSWEGTTSALQATDIIVGDAGSGYFSQFNSTVTIAGTLTLGKQGEGMYTLGAFYGLDDTELASGGTLQTANIIVGDAGDGSFSQIDSAVNIADTLTLGKQQWGTGRYYMGLDLWGVVSLSNNKPSGGTLQAANIIVGDAGAGSFSQLNSAVTVTDTLTLGKQQGGEGWYSMGQYIWDIVTGKGSEPTSGGTLQAANIIIGDAGKGSFTQFASTTAITDTLTLGKQQGGVGSYSMGEAQWVPAWDFDDMHEVTQLVAAGGGTLQAADLVIGDAGTGSFSQIDSTTRITNILTLGKQQGGAGSYSLGAYDSSYGGGTLQATGLIVGDAGEGSFRQIASAAVNSTTTIADTLTVAKQSGSEGHVNISGGTLSAAHIVVGVDGHGEMAQSGGSVIADTMTISDNSEVTLSGGALLVNDSLTNDGLLTLTQAGLLTVGNTFTNTGTLVIDLGTYTGGSFITLLHSTADLDGELKIINSTGRSLEGVTFDLLYAEGALLGDLDFEGHVTADLGDFRFAGLSLVGNGLRLNLTSGPAAVPTPSSILLLSSALLMLAGWRQRSIQ